LPAAGPARARCSPWPAAASLPSAHRRLGASSSSSVSNIRTVHSSTIEHAHRGRSTPSSCSTACGGVFRQHLQTEGVLVEIRPEGARRHNNPLKNSALLQSGHSRRPPRRRTGHSTATSTFAKSATLNCN
jgi:hypothetical protein